MVMANPERVSRALDLFRDGLRPACEQSYSGFYGDDWIQTVNQKLNHPDSNPSSDDIALHLRYSGAPK